MKICLKSGLIWKMISTHQFMSMWRWPIPVRNYQGRVDLSTLFRYLPLDRTEVSLLPWKLCKVPPLSTTLLFPLNSCSIHTMSSNSDFMLSLMLINCGFQNTSYQPFNWEPWLVCQWDSKHQSLDCDYIPMLSMCLIYHFIEIWCHRPLPVWLYISPEN